MWAARPVCSDMSCLFMLHFFASTAVFGFHSPRVLRSHWLLWRGTRRHEGNRNFVGCHVVEAAVSHIPGCPILSHCFPLHCNLDRIFVVRKHDSGLALFWLPSWTELRLSLVLSLCPHRILQIMIYRVQEKSES